LSTKRVQQQHFYTNSRENGEKLPYERAENVEGSDSTANKRLARTFDILGLAQAVGAREPFPGIRDG
jgi:hypothetical protein